MKQPKCLGAVDTGRDFSSDTGTRDCEKVNEIWQLKVMMGKVTHGEVETSETNLNFEVT